MIDALRSEWIKTSTIRINWVFAILAVSLPLVITVLTSTFSSDPLTGADLGETVTVPATAAALLLAVASSMATTSELSHGTIRPTFAAMPDRLRPLLAKPIIHCGIASVATAATVTLGWVAGAAIAEGSQASSDTGALPALIGVIVLAAGLSLLGYALGLLLRNPAATVAALLLWPLFVEEVLIGGLLVSVVVDAPVARQWLPYLAGLNMAAIEPNEDLLGRVPGGLYFLAWTAGIALLATLRARRRDA
jgi:ABC-2 type transport system permease protein